MRLVVSMVTAALVLTAAADVSAERARLLHDAPLYASLESATARTTLRRGQTVTVVERAVMTVANPSWARVRHKRVTGWIPLWTLPWGPDPIYWDWGATGDALEVVQQIRDLVHSMWTVRNRSKLSADAIKRIEQLRGLLCKQIKARRKTVCRPWYDFWDDGKITATPPEMLKQLDMVAFEVAGKAFVDVHRSSTVAKSYKTIRSLPGYETARTVLERYFAELASVNPDGRGGRLSGTKSCWRATTSPAHPQSNKAREPPA